MNKVYIISTGSFLPNEPVENADMEDFLGKFNGVSSRTKDIFLRKNGIKTRYYALDREQNTTHKAYEMAALAVKDCIDNSPLAYNQIELLSTATTQSDMPVPGFASMVHAASGIKTCGIASHQSVCAASMMAIQNAFNQIKSGQVNNAVCCAAELSSRMFKSKRFQGQQAFESGSALPVEIDFLRWMLSDGAGAMLLQNHAISKGLSLEIEWVDLKSHAQDYEVCMYTGTNKETDGTVQKTWLDYDTIADANAAGAVNLKQDMQLVDNIVKLGIQRFFELVDEGKFMPEDIDWLVCHYSSHHFRPQIVDLLQKGGVEIPPEKWFTNLYTVGNIGSASVFVMLDELMKSGQLKAGQNILCMVPESGRFITGYMMLTVRSHSEQQQSGYTEEIAEIRPPEIRVQDKPVQEWLVRQLTGVWFDFERGLQQVPIVKKIFKGTLTLEEYKRLLVNLRQQVIDGSQWIARAASNVSMAYFPVRSAFIRHSSDEHRDYQILEKNYINCGGREEDILTGNKNIGSEALSAYMFHRASQPDPFDLLGGMFIIEGLGNRVSGKWGRAIQQQLRLDKDQVSFFIYHESSDSNDNHFERFEQAIQSDLLTRQMAEKIVKTAKVVAKLYTMQLEEIDNF
jgi:3-oxoacyl-[acyl-carrier-protein] synthase-3